MKQRAGETKRGISRQTDQEVRDVNVNKSGLKGPTDSTQWRDMITHDFIKASTDHMCMIVCAVVEIV